MKIADIALNGALMLIKVPELKQKAKRILVLISALIVGGCASQPTPPQWFMQQTLTPAAYEYFGYGVGSTLAEAEAVAKNDIATTLNSQVRSSVMQSVSTNNKEVQALSASKMLLTTDITLSNAMKVKAERVGNKYYVIYSYLNIPLSQKIKNAFSDTTKCGVNSHPYLSNTPLFKEIETKLACLPELSIAQRHNQFYLNFEQNSFPLSAGDEMRLFTTVKSAALELQLSRNVINSGQYYHINITPIDSGYLSLVQLYDDGTVQLLVGNMSVPKRQAFTYPNLNDYHGLEAYNAELAPIQDLTLAIQCKKPIDIMGLPTVSEHISQSKVSFFNYLMDISKDCSVAGQTQVIQPTISL